MKQKRRIAMLVAAVVGLAASDTTVAEEPAPKAAASALDYIPTDAVVVISFRIADYWNQPRFKTEREALRAGIPQAFEGFRDYFGSEPNEVERMTFFSARDPQITSTYGPVLEPAVVVTTLKAYDRKTILKDMPQREERVKFLDDRTFVIGLPGSLERYLKRPAAGKEGPMAPILKLAAEKHLLVIGMNVSEVAQRVTPADKAPPEFKPFTPLLKAQFATLVVDLDDRLRAHVKASFANDADAKEGAAAVDDALDLARGAFVQGLKQLSQTIDAPKAVALLKDVQAALRAVKAEPKGATVEVDAALKIDLKATASAAMEVMGKAGDAAKRIQITNDLKQLVRAWQRCSDANGALPPAAVYDKNGKPLLSWRVLVLPYIEKENLYKEFHLDEPWDSKHNKKLLAKMPEVFAPKDTEAYKNHETFFQGYVGKGTLFEKSGLRFPIDIPDGLSNTILFVEAEKAVPWTKPEDIPFDDGKLLPKVGGMSKDGFLAAMCDGSSVRFIPLTVKEDDLRTWIIRNSRKVRPDLDK